MPRRRTRTRRSRSCSRSRSRTRTCKYRARTVADTQKKKKRSVKSKLKHELKKQARFVKKVKKMLRASQWQNQRLWDEIKRIRKQLNKPSTKKKSTKKSNSVKPQRSFKEDMDLAAERNKKTFDSMLDKLSKIVGKNLDDIDRDYDQVTKDMNKATGKHSYPAIQPPVSHVRPASDATPVNILVPRRKTKS